MNPDDVCADEVRVVSVVRVRKSVAGGEVTEWWTTDGALIVRETMRLATDKQGKEANQWG